MKRKHSVMIVVQWGRSAVWCQGRDLKGKPRSWCSPVHCVTFLQVGLLDKWKEMLLSSQGLCDDQMQSVY